MSPSVAVAGEADAELGVAGFGGEGNGAAVLLGDALHDAEAEAGAYADGLGGVEGVEDAGLAFQRDAGAVVGNRNAKVAARLAGRPGVTGRLFLPGVDANVAALGDRVDGIVQQVRPDLVEPGALALQGGQVRGEVLFEDDLLLAKLVAEDGQGCVEALVDRTEEERRVGKECRSRWSPYHRHK